MDLLDSNSYKKAQYLYLIKTISKRNIDNLVAFEFTQNSKKLNWIEDNIFQLDVKKEIIVQHFICRMLSVWLNALIDRVIIIKYKIYI